jgi:hypothetical protein
MMKVLYVKDKGYYVAGCGEYWSTWTNNISEATVYDEPAAHNVARDRSSVTGHKFEVREVPISDEELEALRHRNPEQIRDVYYYHNLLMGGMFQ